MGSTTVYNLRKVRLSDMKTFEYDTKEFSKLLVGCEIKERLNELGKQGWELVSVVDEGCASIYLNYILKREHEEFKVQQVGI